MDSQNGNTSGENSLPENFVVNRTLAYLGKLGHDREAFCQGYVTALKKQHTGLAGRLKQQAAEKGKPISCARGCASCCHLCVIASIQECEAIVYYLYQHEDILQHFLASFERWRVQVRGIWDAFQEIIRLESKRLSSGLSDEEENTFGDMLFEYRQAEIPCPFLKEGGCSIYEVRPFVCAGLVATTPAEWCSYLHPCYERSEFIALEPDEKEYVPYFANPKEKTCFACMPVGVFEILYNGWGFLWGLPGCNWLEEKVRNDPEIVAALHGFQR